MYFNLEKGFKMRTHTAFLVSLLQGKELTRVAEIGVWKGDNAYGLLTELPIDFFVGVDPYVRYPEFDDNLSNKIGIMATADMKVIRKGMMQRMQEFGDRFKHLPNFSLDAAKMFDDETFDFVFIDGNHWYSYVVDDIAAWLPKVKPGGILAGHDYVQKVNCGVIPAVQNTLPDHQARPKAKVWWYEVQGGEEVQFHTTPEEELPEEDVEEISEEEVEELDNDLEEEAK